MPNMLYLSFTWHGYVQYPIDQRYIENKYQREDQTMTRKENEKESDRPHYYSQFWLDVAAGRRIIGTPRPGEEGETAEAEPVEPVAPRRSGRTNNASESRTAMDGHRETIVHPVVEAASDEFADNDEIGGVDDIDFDQADSEDAGAPDVDLGPLDAKATDEDAEETGEDEEEVFEEEEEEDEDWAGRGRKKPKPTRQVKQPPKRVKRERRV